MDISLQAMKERFHAATENFVTRVKDDPNVIAVIVCGSLAYDQVWERSDIDMTVVIRDQVLKNDSYCIVEDDILINVHLVPRNSFKRNLERAIGGSFLQSYFSQGKIIYTTDNSLYDYLEDITQIGNDDIALYAFYITSQLLYEYEKASKWLHVKKDPLYAQYYLLKAAISLSTLEVTLQGLSPTREVIQQALSINPQLILPYYQGAMSRIYAEEELSSLLEGIDQYMKKHLDIIKQPIVEYMKDQELKTVTMLAKHFRTEGQFLIHILDYLAEQGVIVKVSQTIRLTPRGRKSVEEIGFIYIP